MLQFFSLTLMCHGGGYANWRGGAQGLVVTVKWSVFGIAQEGFVCREKGVINANK
jgi:hypothetical protein